MLVTPTGKRSRGRPRTRWINYISDLACPPLCVEPAELSEIAVNLRLFLVLLKLPPPQTSPEKRGCEDKIMIVCNVFRLIMVRFAIITRRYHYEITKVKLQFLL